LARNLVNTANRVPILWIRGAADSIVSDKAAFDLAQLGKLGVIPGWPGDEVVPSQPMVSQTRAVLEKYKQNGGSYQEVVIEKAGHSPYLQKPEEFNSSFFAFLVDHSKK
jgi:pimeloyl-ACP methyl ester carboxylesterase